MKIISTLILLSSPVISLAFAPGVFSTTKQNKVLVSLQSAEGDNSDKEPSISKAPTDDFSAHEELMYALGVNLARQLGDIRPLVENGEELTYVAKGLLDAIVGRLDEEGQLGVIQKRGPELNALITERANKIRSGIEQAGEQMLATMSETEGVETLPSGVRVHVLEEVGSGGSRPTTASNVKVHYHGTLPDGSVFDSTLGQDEPITIPVDAVIPGYKEGLLQMKEGQTAMIGIPSSMAYGAEGSVDGRVPGGSAIFFKVQLIEVLSSGIGGAPTLLGADGKKLTKDSNAGSLLGADGKPLFK